MNLSLSLFPHRVSCVRFFSLFGFLFVASLLFSFYDRQWLSQAHTMYSHMYIVAEKLCQELLQLLYRLQ